MEYALNAKHLLSKHSVKAVLIMHFTLINALIAALLQVQILVDNVQIIFLLKLHANLANLLQVHQIAQDALISRMYTLILLSLASTALIL